MHIGVGRCAVAKVGPFCRVFTSQPWNEQGDNRNWQRIQHLHRLCHTTFSDRTFYIV